MTSQEIITINNLMVTLMNTEFTVFGKTYTPSQLGWTSGYHNRKGALGTCNRRYKTVKLSKYILENSNILVSDWEDTIRHEIAHAIDFEIRGRSAHDNYWKSIAVQVGAKPQSGKNAKIDPKSSKYTLECPGCKKQTASHKKRKRSAACGECCNKLNNGRYDSRFELVQIQNY